MCINHVTSPLSGGISGFIMDVFFHSFLAIANLPSDGETSISHQSLSLEPTPRMHWPWAVSHLLTSEILENCWLCGIFPEAIRERAEGKGKQKRTTLYKVLNVKLRPLDLIRYTVENHWRLLITQVKWSKLYFRNINSTVVWKLVWKGRDQLENDFKSQLRINEGVPWLWAWVEKEGK